MAGEPILVVDDNEANLKLVRVLLLGDDYVVHTAPDAETALAALPELRPRLILMDLQLPGMDGLALTRALRLDPQYRDIVIIALTAYAMKGDDEKAFAAGCDGYVTKPINLDLLLATIASHLR
jgi:CheY-like chemotaxis protein